MSTRAWARAMPLLLPLVLVNAAAVYGQGGWAYDHLIHNVVIAGLFAAAVESIGVYLAFEAHAALMAGDASARLRTGSYLIGLLAGALNYAHFAGPGYRPNPLAVTFAALSSISPWLWAIRSRSMNRVRLRELGQIDPRAVRFATLRWMLFPARTMRAFRVAVWHGIQQPTEAIDRSGVRAPGTQRAVTKPTPAAPGEALEIAALGTPAGPANPGSLPAALPQVIEYTPPAIGAAAEPASEPRDSASRDTPSVADQVRRVTAAFRAQGVEPEPRTVAFIVGTDNLRHVKRVMAKASTPAELEAAGQTTADLAALDRALADTDDARELEDATT